MYRVEMLSLDGEWLEDHVFESYEDAIRFVVSIAPMREVFVTQEPEDCLFDLETVG